MVLKIVIKTAFCASTLKYLSFHYRFSICSYLRKVASISGDCRRALDISRRAIEIGAKHCIGKALVVTTFHVVQAFNETIINPKLIAIKGCSKFEKFFLQAVGAEVNNIQYICTLVLCNN